jgi:hypothetical protein
LSLIGITLLISTIWYWRLPSEQERRLVGEWLYVKGDGSKSVFVLDADRTFEVWIVQPNGDRMPANGAGRWSCDSRTIVLRESRPGRSTLEKLLQQNQGKTMYLDVEAMQDSQVVTRFRGSGLRVEWNRLVDGNKAGPRP